MMYFLLLDTADARGSVALFRSEELLALDPHPAEEDFSSWLLPAVRRLLDDNRLTHTDLDAYAVCSGPGSFTGLRVGLTSVKAWAEIYRKPIAAVSRLEAFAAGDVRSGTPDPPYTAVFSDARRGQVFAALYDRSSNAIEPETVMALETFLATAGAVAQETAILWKTPDPALLVALPQWRARLECGDSLEPVGTPFAGRLGRLAWRKFLERQTTDALALDANYVRRSDAELFWKDHACEGKA
jgi:tRNA threonylcarbamoyladenosine biosynthesis protein TsaB